MQTFIFNIFATDVHHSHSSRYLIGVVTDASFVQPLINKYIRKHHSAPMRNEQQQQLKDMHQTQGYHGAIAGEFLVEEVPVNTVL